MTINQVKCDGCGKVEEIVITLPPQWKRTYDEQALQRDLCPDCTKKVEEFIQSLKK